VSAACGGTTGPGLGDGGPGATGSEGGASADLVAQCQALANNFGTLCMGDAPRPCMWSGYAKLCTSGRTQLLIDSMKCLDQTTCRTFSDPNQGEACLVSLHGTPASAASNMLIENMCAACGGTNCVEQDAIAEIVPYLTDGDVVALNACRGTACDLNAIVKSCASVPTVGLFSACVQ
jgi:hypothetical protein